MGIGGKDCVRRWLILEFTFISTGRNDGGIDAKYSKAIKVLATLIANLDDVALTGQQFGAAVLIVLALGHRVPGRGWNLEWPASLRLSETISAHRLYPLSPRSEKSPYGYTCST